MHQRNGLLLLAEGAGRRLASLTGFRGVPENLFLFFLHAAFGGVRREEKVGAQPQTPG